MQTLIRGFGSVQSWSIDALVPMYVLGDIFDSLCHRGRAAVSWLHSLRSILDGIGMCASWMFGCTVECEFLQLVDRRATSFCSDSARGLDHGDVFHSEPSEFAKLTDVGQGCS